jgi:hypothetical protein
MKTRNLLTFWLLLAVLAAACNFLPRPVAPTPTQIPAAADLQGCSADAALASLRNSEPFNQLLAEFSVDYSQAAGIRYLDIWFVDPNIPTGAAGADLEENQWIAAKDAAAVAIYALAVEPCGRAVFDAVNPVVVDQEYNGWFSASIAISEIPDTTSPGDQDYYDVVDAFQIVYARQSLPAVVEAPPAGSCTWQVAHQRMHLHFDPSRQNVDFYFVGDEVSRKVTAQWDGAAATNIDVGVIYASILNVAQEIRCLYPPPDYLYIMVVDPQGSMVWWGRLPQAGIQAWDLNQLEVLYPPVNP